MILHLKNIFNTLCRKASQKLHALSRISQYLSQHKKQILFKTFVMSQNYQYTYKSAKNSVSRQFIFTGFTTERQICVYPHEKLTIFSYRNL